MAGIAKGRVLLCTEPPATAMPIFPCMEWTQCRHLVNQLGKLICLKKKVAEVGELIIQLCRELCQHMAGGYCRDEWRGDVTASLQGHAASYLQS